MANGWMGLNTALSGLRTAQQMLDISAHNIANASTPGYSRQRAEIVASPPFSLPAFNRTGLPGQLGTGVTISSIYRIRDTFLDGQISEQVAAGGYWSARGDGLSAVEAAFPEPSGSGMGTALSRFWSAWEDVAADPGSSAARTSVISETQTLAARFVRDSGQLASLVSSADVEVRGAIGQANDLASRIAALNKQIQGIVVSGDHANDLEDQRDVLLEQLNAIIPTQNVRLADGTVSVLVGGTDLVDHDETRLITAVDDGSGHAVPTWESGGAVDLAGGKLKGLVELRDETLAGYVDDLNALAKTIADAVNTAHTGGVDGAGNPGLALFTYTAGSEASTLALNAAIGTDPALIVSAATAGAPGDASIAAQIADLRTAGIFGTGTQTPTDAYAAFIGQIGTDSRQASELAANQGLVVEQLQTRRESISGVSLDEEAADVIRFQQAYSASARVITAIDEMLDQLINRTGVVGR
jgi:flagellar hook-associated protein 1 FlgK